MIKLGSGIGADLSSLTSALRAVLIKGEVTHEVAGATDQQMVGAGGYFTSDAAVPHSISCTSTDECLIYVRTEGPFLLD